MYNKNLKETEMSNFLEVNMHGLTNIGKAVDIDELRVCFTWQWPTILQKRLKENKHVKY
jgi:hypothetical protein